MAKRSHDDDLLADLTPEQQEAVTHRNGPLLIIAGPGSGKTRVITRRVAWLLRSGVRPHNILAITFTNKAAGEMRQRVDVLVPGNRVLVRTFHSFGAMMLRQYADRVALDRNFSIYDMNDRSALLKEAVELSEVDSKLMPPERAGGAISRAKNLLQTAEQYAARVQDDFGERAARVYGAYEKRLRESNALDFDDLLLLPALLLRQDEELRAELDARYQYVLIDEYQDTNLAQYAIARALSVDQPNLCVVGDVDQSIYKWRGADIKNILDFERDYPDTKLVMLTRNYRSTKNILHAADTVIGNNTRRKRRELVTDNPAGEPVRVLTFESGLDEAEGIARRISQAVREKKRRFHDFAIFLRMNALSRVLESAFVRHGVAYQFVRGLAFYDRKENRDIIAYLRVLVNPQDDLSFLRAIGEPSRGVGAKSLQHLRDYATPRELSLLTAAGQIDRIPAIKGKAAAALRDFAALMARLREYLEAAPDEVIRQVLDRSGYRAMLQGSSDEADQERLANIEEFITAARQFAADDETRTISDFLEGVALVGETDGFNESEDSVAVMTLHASKGLEFPVVYMLAVEQGILPHERSIAREEEIEEERRLCFVGMTRAKEELYLSHARLREFRGQFLYAVPSMFLDELPESGVERDDRSVKRGMSAQQLYRTGGSAAADVGWQAAGVSSRGRIDADGLGVGVIVDHASYGRGKVLDVSGHGSMRRVRVRFAQAGEKSFAGEKIRLTVVADE